MGPDLESLGGEKIESLSKHVEGMKRKKKGVNLVLLKERQ